jgi:hypothetical protein
MLMNKGNFVISKVKIIVEFVDRQEKEPVWSNMNGFMFQGFQIRGGRGYFVPTYEDVKLYDCEIMVEAGFKRHKDAHQPYKKQHRGNIFHTTVNEYFKFDHKIRPLMAQIRSTFPYIQIKDYELSKSNRKLNGMDLRSVPDKILIVVDDPVRAKRALVANYI